jgi:hypothetical protein
MGRVVVRRGWLEMFKFANYLVSQYPSRPLPARRILSRQHSAVPIIVVIIFDVPQNVRRIIENVRALSLSASLF